MELSKEQQLAFDKYVEGKNIFITGPGGSGKSELIRRIYQHATRNFKDIHVCALTGCAAVLLNCNAKTIHSFAGIGLGNGNIERLVQKIKQNKFAKNMWRTTEILIVDEVSMMSLKLFDALNHIGKAMRNNCSRPFGGIQVIFSGDFYQLPPVGNKEELDTTRFCFESDDWNSVFHRDCQVQLKKIFRQQSDDTYVSILNQIREGKIKRKTNDILLQYVGRKCDDADLVVTKLFPTKNKVETINNNKMAELVGEEREYIMKYITNAEPTAKHEQHYSDSEIQYELEYMGNNLICDKTIKIKVGSQVMCVINIQSDQGVDICNGSQGIVTGFCEITGCPKVKYNNGREMVMARHTWTSEKIPGIGVTQVPLILAWALTIHKSQGATLDAAEIDVGSGIFECGQTYVALSRVKSLNGLYLTSFDVAKIKINKKVNAFYEALNLYNSENLVPLIIIEA
jgi:ATP-dependent DNA helicase PIF1